MGTDHYGQFVRELTGERVAALTRISRTLDALIQQLREALDGLPALDDPERTRDLVACRALRQQALRYRWYLEVQREALGLRHHHRLDEFYEIPGPV